MRVVLSHPETRLIDHLSIVARDCGFRFQAAAENCDLASQLLFDIGYIVGAVHDIGKATGHFQEYIRSGGEIIKHPKHHAPISAFVGKFVFEQYLESCDLLSYDAELLGYFVFTAIKRHHGRLLNFESEIVELYTLESDLMYQLKDIWEPEVNDMMDQLLDPLGISFEWRKFQNYLGSFVDICNAHAEFAYGTFEDKLIEAQQQDQVKYFYLHQALFSSLLMSDKSDVILNLKIDDQRIESGLIEQYRIQCGFEKPSSEINRMKNQAYANVLNSLSSNFSIDQHLYSITLPTGLGKTITSFAAALAIKEAIGESCTRIVICIPFTSIIDQNFTVFEDIMAQPSTELLLKHHHLADPRYKLSDDSVDQPTQDESKFLIETWQSQVIVTTFVQFLETIFSNDKSKLLKFANLCNTVVLFDEVQQIPYPLWNLIRASLQVLGDKFGGYFILMSATQPLIFDPESEIVELVPQYKRYFQFFNRTRIINCSKSLVSLEDFCMLVADYHGQYPEKSILVILNTKSHTLECFKKLSEMIPESSADLYFLSTLITPFERKRIIQELKSDDSNSKVIVSTQLIEAGVDISVDTVFRNIAPIDSLIQAAGRANRYSESPQVGEVYVYRIQELEKASSLIYGSDLIQKSMNALSQFDVILEKDYLDLIAGYFAEVRMQADNSDSGMLESLRRLEFGTVGQFKFIEQQETESVFVMLNEQSKTVWHKYSQLCQKREVSHFERKKEFSQFKSVFYDYVINVPVRYDESAIKFDSEPQHNFYLSDMDSPSEHYHYEEGNYRANWGYTREGNDTIFF